MTTVEERLRPLKPVGRFVGGKAWRLQSDYLGQNPSAKALAAAKLARLRRAVGQEPGSVPEIWPVTMDGVPLPEHYRDDKPTLNEIAVHAALTLFAMHQQSRREPMHERGRGLGAAVRLLCAQAPSEGAVRRRFEALATAATFAETLTHARGLIGQLRARGIPMDYGLFADDLVSLQQRPGGPNRVRLTWGRDFYLAGIGVSVAGQRTEPEHEREEAP